MVHMEKFMVREYLQSTIAEAYRKVIANIEFANVDDNIKTIIFTSSLSGEGKTTTVCNIASLMTDLNKKILLLDLDLRKPSVHKHFNISNEKGITDLLLTKEDYKKYVNTVYKGLDVITSGKIPSNPPEVVNSKALRELIKELSCNYDYILIDSPPVIMVSDPIIISSFIDAVILTISYATTEKDIVRKAVSSLKNVNANIIGTILNKVPITKHDKNYYSYY